MIKKVIRLTESELKQVVENIAKEVFLAMEILFSKYENLRIHSITLWETPNSATTCIAESIHPAEKDNWLLANEDAIAFYRDEKGYMEYDDRKI
jgi:6-pyruvoyltetrahydropterin/6-carboxytetrahydropterin synthase